MLSYIQETIILVSLSQRLGIRTDCRGLKIQEEMSGVAWRRSRDGCHGTGSGYSRLSFRLVPPITAHFLLQACQSQRLLLKKML